MLKLVCLITCVNLARCCVFKRRLRKGDWLLEVGYCSASKEGNELIGLFNGWTFIVKKLVWPNFAHLLFVMGMTILWWVGLPFLPLPHLPLTDLAETEFKLISFNSIIETKETHWTSNTELCLASWRPNFTISWSYFTRSWYYFMPSFTMPNFTRSRYYSLL